MRQTILALALLLAAHTSHATTSPIEPSLTSGDTYPTYCENLIGNPQLLGAATDAFEKSYGLDYLSESKQDIERRTQMTDEFLDRWERQYNCTLEY